MNYEPLQTLAILAGILIGLFFLVIYYFILEIQKRKELEKKVTDLDNHMTKFFIEQEIQRQQLDLLIKENF